MADFLTLPQREQKPRKKGLTIVIDNGYPLQFYADVLSSHGHLIDYIKFGWGTSYVTKDLEKKVMLAKEHDIETFFGGTFFEKVISQNQLPAYISHAKDLGIKYMEVSNGTIELENIDKAKYIEELAKDFTVFSEVGYKDQQRSQELTPSKWVEYINQDLSAGAFKVFTESRESGSSGICRSNGELRFGLIGEILDSGIEVDRLIFEAPKKGMQIYFINCIGHDVNLANISFNDIIGLETLRLGLRGDTFFSVKSAECERAEY